MSHKRKAKTKLAPVSMVLRCFAEKKANVWQAFCIDLNLAVQGNSLHEVKLKLHAQIGEYLYDALVGPDKEYAEQLLSRRAPLLFRARYYVYKTLSRIAWAHNGIREIFSEVMPLAPVTCA